MKPRNKREREVAELSSKLPPLVDEKEWAKSHLFSHEAFKCKNEMWCSDCSGTWIDTDNSKSDKKVECPYCHNKLDVKVSRKQRNEDVNYMTVATVFRGYQVLRHVYCFRTTRKNGAYLFFFFKEVVQEWISEDGKRTIMGVSMNMGANGWRYGEDLSIKKEYGSGYYHSYGDLYAIYGEMYPKVRLLPILRKYGLRKTFFNCHPSKLIRLLLQGHNDLELCIKTKQISMLQLMMKQGTSQLKDKPSFNICNRNGYIIKDASIWTDYVDLLSYFRKDLRNAYYVCPKNLKREHDLLVEKMNKIEARNRARRAREEAIQKDIRKKEDILNFYREKAKFFGIEIKDGEINIHPLESVTQFYLEAKAMHHCVFSNRYYGKDGCLILSARDSQGNRLETVEVNLNTFDIVQSRAVCNGTSEYHEKIVNLVKNNMNLIRQRMAC